MIASYLATTGLPKWIVLSTVCTKVPVASPPGRGLTRSSVAALRDSRCRPARTSESVAASLSGDARGNWRRYCPRLAAAVTGDSSDRGGAAAVTVGTTGALATSNAR